MPTVYDAKTGKSVNFIHMIDAKEALATGRYINTPPPPPAPEPKKVEKDKVVKEEIPEVKEEPPKIEDVKKELPKPKPKPIKKIIKE